MLPILQIGPLALQFPGLIILLGLWLGLSFAEKHVKDHVLRDEQPGNGKENGPQAITAPTLYNLAVGSLLASILGARLFYILQYTQVFVENPTSIFSLNTSLLDVRGAFLGALIFALYYGQKKSLQFWPVLDALTPAFAFFAIAVHLANLASGNGFGSETQVPWSIQLWGANRHPVQIYEAAAALLILFLLWPGQSRLPITKPGQYFLYFLSMSSASRLLLEAFHGDSRLIAGSFRLVQILAWLILALCFYFLVRLGQETDQDIPQVASEKGSSG